MPRLDSFLLCDSVARDAQTGKWILTGVFTTLWAQSFPASHPSMDAFFRLRFDAPPSADPIAVRVTYRTPSGSVQHLPDLRVRPDAQGTAEGFVRLQGLRLEEPGVYEFQVTVNDDVLGGTMIMAATVPQPTGTVH